LALADRPFAERGTRITNLSAERISGETSAGCLGLVPLHLISSRNRVLFSSGARPKLEFGRPTLTPLTHQPPRSQRHYRTPWGNSEHVPIDADLVPCGICVSGAVPKICGYGTSNVSRTGVSHQTLSSPTLAGFFGTERWPLASRFDNGKDCVECSFISRFLPSASNNFDILNNVLRLSVMVFNSCNCGGD
jgi:hypothetical protein